MEPERQEYEGHRIELRAREGREEVRAREAEREEELELLIDDEPVPYGQLRLAETTPSAACAPGVRGGAWGATSFSVGAGRPVVSGPSRRLPYEEAQ